MSRELSIAYSRIKREWPGLAIRQHQPRQVGWPDFILIYEGEVVFTEVKWIERPTRLEPMQAHWLEKLFNNGVAAIVLGCHPGGWVAWTNNWQTLSNRGALSVDSGFAFWRGAHLSGLPRRPHLPGLRRASTGASGAGLE